MALNRAALYMRLSRDDENAGESVSIGTQRMILNAYAQEHSFTVQDEYVDDGYSGTNFDRPAFKRMIRAIEEKKIDTVIVKDLSRFGRNHILVDDYIESWFPARRIRFIAIADQVDTFKEENDFAPFKNLFNEYYARTCSRNVKSALNARFKKGGYHGPVPPLGYKKSDAGDGRLVEDPDTSWIIRIIFDLSLQGRGASFIARRLTEQGVPSPAQLHNPLARPKTPWLACSVLNILRNDVYTGDSTHYKITSISFKDHRKIKNSSEKWKTVTGTHPALISLEDFRRNAQLMQSRRRAPRLDRENIFSGILQCADCGYGMHMGINKRVNGEIWYYTCGKYSQRGKGACTSHYIRYDDLCRVVLERLQFWISSASIDEENLAEMLASKLKSRNGESREQILEKKRSAQKRMDVLDNILAKLYDDFINGSLNERNFDMLSKKYQDEQSKLEAAITDATKSLENQTLRRESVRHFISIIKKYTEMTELTSEIVHALIEKIVIHEKDDNGVRSIEIIYRFIGDVSQ